MKREETVDFNIKAAWHAIARMYNQQALKYNGTMSIDFMQSVSSAQTGMPLAMPSSVTGMSSLRLRTQWTSFHCISMPAGYTSAQSRAMPP